MSDCTCNEGERDGSFPPDPQCPQHRPPDHPAAAPGVFRANYLPAPHAFELTLACRVLREALCGAGGGIYLVGSCMERRDYRDVDVRCILPDEAYDALFSSAQVSGMGTSRDAFWSLLCTAVSLWLSKHTGLPIDFQIQRQTQANEKYGGKRSALGLFTVWYGGGQDTETAP